MKTYRIVAEAFWYALCAAPLVWACVYLAIHKDVGTLALALLGGVLGSLLVRSA